jgi:hypothetical protein
MGALAGFVLGYVVGAKQGPEGYARMREAWETILAAPEVKALLERAPTLADMGAGAAGGVLAKLKTIASGNEQLGAAWQTLAANETLHSLVATGLHLAGGVLERGMALVSGARSE